MTTSVSLHSDSLINSTLTLAHGGPSLTPYTACWFLMDGGFDTAVVSLPGREDGVLAESAGDTSDTE